MIGYIYMSLFIIYLNHSQVNGLGEISGKKDPVKLDSSSALLEDILRCSMSEIRESMWADLWLSVSH